MIALVFGEIFGAIFSGSMLNVSGQMSTNTGLAPASAIVSAVAMKVNGDVMTSSPAPMPQARKASRSASVPLAHPTAKGRP